MGQYIVIYLKSSQGTARVRMLIVRITRNPSDPVQFQRCYWCINTQPCCSLSLKIRISTNEQTHPCRRRINATFTLSTTNRWAQVKLQLWGYVVLTMFMYMLCCDWTVVSATTRHTNSVGDLFLEVVLFSGNLHFITC